MLKLCMHLEAWCYYYYCCCCLLLQLILLQQQQWQQQQLLILLLYRQFLFNQSIFQVVQMFSFWNNGARLLQAECPSWHPMNSDKALKERTAQYSMQKITDIDLTLSTRTKIK